MIQYYFSKKNMQQMRLKVWIDI